MFTYLTVQGLPPGTLGYEFLKVVDMYLRSMARNDIELRGDKLVILKCTDLGRAIREVLDNIHSKRIYMSGNDVRYVISHIAGYLGLSERPTAYDLIKVLADGLVDNGCGLKVLSQSFTVPSLFKANFYEYGKAFLQKPSRDFVYVEKVSGASILLAMLGALLSYAGTIRLKEDVDLTRYLLISESLKPQYKKARDIMIGAYRILYSNQEIATRLSDITKTIYLTTSLSLAMSLRESSLGKLVSIMEGDRPSVIKVEDINTSGLVDLLNSIKVRIEGGEWLIRVFKCFLETPSRVNPNSESFSKIVDLVNSVAEHFFTYTQTGSTDSLLLVTRLIEEFVSPHIKARRDDVEMLKSGWCACLNKDIEITKLAENLKEFLGTCILFK